MIDFANGRQSAPQARGARAASNEQPKAQLWLNIGYDVPAPTAEDPNATKFVSLPVGIPLDTMEPIKVNGQNADYNKFVDARNQLLASLIAGSASLAPGEDDLVNLSIQVRRVSAPATVDSANNEMAIADVKQLFGRTAAPAAA